jgi:plasmid stabilization system protein ParE
LKLRRVRFTEGARAQIAEQKRWWAHNRDHMEVFGEELQEAVALLRISPAAGTGYPRPAFPGLRRVYLRRLSLHLYYTFGDAEVIVRAVWHAKRRKGPILALR